jgi:multiple sugar transport system permease protein
VVRGGVVATLILCVLFTWNEFFIALVLSGRDTQTLPVTITSFLTYQGVEWGALTAAATLIMLPMIILGMLVQGSVVRGMTLGGVKG